MQNPRIAPTPCPPKTAKKNEKFKRTSSWSQCERHASLEDGIARQVFWRALIRHLGKRSKDGVGIVNKGWTFGPNVRYIISRMLSHRSDHNNDQKFPLLLLVTIVVFLCVLLLCFGCYFVVHYFLCSLFCHREIKFQKIQID